MHLMVQGDSDENAGICTDQQGLHVVRGGKDSWDVIIGPFAIFLGCSRMLYDAGDN